MQPQSPGYYVELSRRGGDLGQSSQMQINRPCLKSKGGYGLGACMSTVVHQTLHRMRYEGVQSVGQHNRTSTHLAQVILQAPSHHPCLRTPDITEFASTVEDTNSATTDPNDEQDDDDDDASTADDAYDHS